MTVHTLASALITRCCGPAACGRFVEADLTNSDAPHGNGRYCIGPACMAWNWASSVDADPLHRTSTSVPAIGGDAFVTACNERSALPVTAPDEEYDAADAIVDQTKAAIRAQLAAWTPEAPAGGPWRLASTEAVFYDDDDPAARFVATWHRDRSPEERNGGCGYVYRG